MSNFCTNQTFPFTYFDVNGDVVAGTAGDNGICKYYLTHIAIVINVYRVLYTIHVVLYEHDILGGGCCCNKSILPPPSFYLISYQ